MTPADTAHLRRLVLQSQTAPWPVAAVRAKANLAAAMEAHGEALLDLAQRALELPPDRPVGQLCVDAEYGRNRRRSQAGYAREHEAKRKQSRALRTARDAVLEAIRKAPVAYSQACSGRVTLEFNSPAEAMAFHCACADLAQADAELLDAAE